MRGLFQRYTVNALTRGSVSLPTKALLTTKQNTQDAHSGGAGTGNVHDQMLPSSGDQEMFRFTKYPHTVSIIG